MPSHNEYYFYYGEQQWYDGLYSGLLIGIVSSMVFASLLNKK